MRRERVIGLLLLIIGLVLIYLFYQMNLFASHALDEFVALGGECTTSEGCLHQEANNWFILGLVPSAIIIAFGIYMMFFFEASPLKDFVKKQDEFEIMLRGLPEEDQKILRIIRDEEGITQATLKYRSGLSKSKLSQVLTDLEKRKLVAREEHGKTKKLFLSRPDIKG